MENNKDVREFENTVISIRGNSLRCKNSVFSIHNIVSMTFDTVQRVKDKPDGIDGWLSFAKNTFKYFLFGVAVLILLIVLEKNDFSTDRLIAMLANLVGVSTTDMGEYFQLFIGSVGLAFLASIASFVIGKLWGWIYESNKYYYLQGLRVVFVNNMTLYFIGNNNSNFIEDTLRGIESFIAEPSQNASREMVINFSNNSVNIDEVSNSNVVGGNVGGGLHNG